MVRYHALDTDIAEIRKFFFGGSRSGVGREVYAGASIEAEARERISANMSRGRVEKEVYRHNLVSQNEDPALGGRTYIYKEV